jgi:hypothetical protein
VLAPNVLTGLGVLVLVLVRLARLVAVGSMRRVAEGVAVGV